MTHAAESTHWYDRDGNPAYTVKAKAGHDRPTTLADARKLSLVPSVTTIIRCAAAPALEMWKANQLMLAALTLPRLDGEPEEAWLGRVKHDSKETARKAAERGTAIHAAIQGAYEDVPPGDYQAYVAGASNAVDAWMPGHKWVAEASFSHPLGFGGKVDLSRFDLGGVIDFKTKEFAETDKLQTWDEHAMQLAAYRVGLGIPDARCAIVYVSVTNPGLARLIEIPQPDLSQGWEMFRSLLNYWQAKTGYQSAFERLAA